MSRIVNATRGFRVAFDGVIWDNGEAKREPDRANESDSLATVSTTPKGACSS